MKVLVIRKGIDLTQTDKECVNVNCEQNGGNCCQSGFCCNKPHTTW